MPDPLSLLTLAAEQGYSPWLIHDDDGHWAVCDDGSSTIRLFPDKPFYFSGTLQPTSWHGTPEQAIIAWANEIGLFDE
jgi:hypothetical protein